MSSSSTSTTSTTAAARAHARAQAGTHTAAMPVVPASQWPTPPAGVDAHRLTWAETVPGDSLVRRCSVMAGMLVPASIWHSDAGVRECGLYSLPEGRPPPEPTGADAAPAPA